MKPTQYYILVALGALCLILSVFSVAISQSNQRLQAQLQASQQEVQRGNVSQQVGNNIVTDLGNLSLTNPKVKDFLAKHGINVSTASPTPTPEQK